MTTRRSFMSFLGAAVLAVSTSVPMLNRRQVEPVRPPTLPIQAPRVGPSLRHVWTGNVTVCPGHEHPDGGLLSFVNCCMDGHAPQAATVAFSARTPLPKNMTRLK